MEYIKKQPKQYTTHPHLSPNSGLRTIRRAWFACSCFLGRVWGILCHFLPLQSKYDTKEAKATRSQRFAISVRSLPVMGSFMVLLMCIAIHCYKLLVIRHSELKAKAQSHCQLIQDMQGARGCIFTVDNKLLAGNYFQKEISIEPKKIPAPYRFKAIMYIANATHKPVSEIARLFFDIIDKDQDIVLSSKVDRHTAKRIEAHGYPHTTIIRNSHHRDKKNPNMISCTTYSVIFTLPLKIQLKQHMPTMLAIGSELGMDEKAVQEAVDGPNGLGRTKKVKIKAELDYAEGVALENNLKTIPNLGKGAYEVKTNTKRTHPQNTLAAPYVGLTNKATGKGISGIEELFDKQLTPTGGRFTILKDGKGRPLPITGTISTTLPVNGDDIFLTINSGIQSITEEEMEKVIPDIKPDRAYAVMMNPRTGAIMALTQYPTFDPNKRDQIPKDFPGMGFLPLTEIFEPGSIMKGISLSCAISEGVIDQNSVYFCENGFWMAAKLHDTHQHGNISIMDIIKYSSNIGTAKAAMDLGSYKLFHDLRSFGFGQKTCLGFYPAGQKPVFFTKETKGLFSSLERWDKLSISRFPIGQGISVTPFQMVQAYGAIANNGVMMQPYIIDRILSHDGTVTSSIPRVKGHPISAKAAKQMKEALKTVIMKDEKSITGEILKKGGTGTKAAIKGYTVAGKTGTSEIWNSQTHEYEKQHVVASFIGFVPADAPEFVLLVTFVNPKPKRHGGTIAAPVFSKIGARTLEYLQVPPEETKEAAPPQNQLMQNQQPTTHKR